MPQRHAIRRQIVEVTVPDPAMARRITLLVSDLIQNRVTPLLERLFDSAAGPDETHRIDRLELDLGRLELGSLADQLLARIETTLPPALRRARATVHAGVGPGVVPPQAGPDGASVRPDTITAPLLLISQFARTGGLPWWCDATRQRPLYEAMETASRESPEAVAGIIRGLLGNDVALERLITHLSDASLERVLAAIAPDANALPHRMTVLLGDTPALAGLTPARRRLTIWRALLRAALTDTGSTLIEAVLTLVAAFTGATLALLLDDMRAAIGRTADLERIEREIAALADRHVPPGGRHVDERLEVLFDRVVGHPDLAGLLARLRPLAAELPDMQVAIGGTADLERIEREIAALADRHVPSGSGHADERLEALFDRVVGHYPDLAGLLARLRPLAAELPDMQVAIGGTADLERIEREIAALADRHPPPVGGRADERLEALFDRLAGHHPDLAGLLVRLRPLAAELPDMQVAIGGTADLERIEREIAALADRHPPPVGGRADKRLEALFDRLAGHHPDLAALLARLRPLAAELPSDGKAACAVALAELGRGVREVVTPAKLAALLRPFTRTRLIALPDVRDMLAPVARAAAAAAVPADPPPRPDVDEDSRIVASAGLCLLWPFLPRFFARLGLLNPGETDFATPADRHRAVLLLHHLATGEAEAPDYALVLPKVLCGLPPHALHHAIAPVTEPEAGEARLLLEAVIAHAACLGQVSPDTFRGAFLSRPGILTIRDGAWLLRVARQTADILLDRFPWTIQWVKLPWMQAPMRVEW